ncbi:hypothetical protein L218DRAFT_953995 [Marasmius fiardii PR-910]|nr:hypothetical protein L218DRAFT_953995 [Marasmius fiardii PR-910]
MKVGSLRICLNDFALIKLLQFLVIFTTIYAIAIASAAVIEEGPHPAPGLAKVCAPCIFQL